MIFIISWIGLLAISLSFYGLGYLIAGWAGVFGVLVFCIVVFAYAILTAKPMAEE